MQKLSKKIWLSCFSFVLLLLYTSPIRAMQNNMDNNIVDDPTVDKALWDACKDGAPELVKVLLKGRANPNAKHQGKHAFPFAAVWADAELVKLFIESKVDLSLDNPLPAASAGNSSQVLQTLIDAKADVNACDSCGRRSICEATKWARHFYARPKIATLLRAGADPELPAMEGGVVGLSALDIALNLKNNTSPKHVREMNKIISLLGGAAEEEEEEEEEKQ